jgi:hypothetical protein
VLRSDLEVRVFNRFSPTVTRDLSGGVFVRFHCAFIGDGFASCPQGVR